MADLRRSHSIRTGRSSPRKTVWNQGPFSAAIQQSTAAGLTLIDTGQTGIGSTTLVRIRGELTVFISVATTIGDGFRKFSAGIGVVSSNAFAIGATAVPSPEADSEWGGWLWFLAAASLVSFETTEVARGPISAVRIPIDSKAMRKLAPNETIFGAIAFTGEIGTATAEFVMNTRMLVKLA